ncbi:MAG: hypothetical protein M1812_003736 [Candelaria pacifica]|nr:MAG: hypothetical protein M1812_003736 [Candelaria pacifica]
MPQIYPHYPPDLTQEQTEYLLTTLKDWSIAHGLAIRPPASFVSEEADPTGVLASTAPVTLFPSPFPRSCFEEARAIQTAYNELYSAIARDRGWLRDIVEDLIEVDDFIAKLWDVHLAVQKEGYAQDLSLGLFRSDYMVHFDVSMLDGLNPDDYALQVKQVEFNTIASSFGGLSSQVSELHKHLLSATAYLPADPPLITPSSLPTNPSIASLSAGLAAAHKAYGLSKSTPPKSLCIIFVVQQPERNAFDQRHLEYHLTTHYQIPTFRLPFTSILTQTHISASNPTRPLIYTPPHSPNTPYEVTTLYLRAGYSPTEYTSDESWKARFHLERSAAIKCPSILTHLAGSKKVQQVLATPDSPHLARFLPDKEVEERVRRTFARMYPLGDGSKAARHVDSMLATAIPIADPQMAIQCYVLKPQREGGGNNIYRNSIRSFLQNMPERQRRAYILMEIIEPPQLSNSILRNGQVESGEVINELGIYGVCLWRNGKAVEEDKGQILENWEAGYLLRTKGKESDEGGVAAGFGAVDSCLLVDV